MAGDFPSSPSNGDTYEGFTYSSSLGAWRSSGAVTLTAFDVITNTPSGNGSLSYTSSNGSFTFTPADATQGGGGVTQDTLDGYLQVANSTSFATTSQLDAYLQVANSTSFATTSQLDNYLQVANGVSLSSFDVITNTPSGNGSLSYTNSNGSFTFTPADLTENSPSVVYALSGTDINPTNGGIQTKTISANTTFTESLGTGDSVVLHITSGASYTVTWPTIKWTGNTTPTLTAADALVLWKVSSTLYGAYVGSIA